MKREHYIPFDKQFLLELQLEAFAQESTKVEDFKKLFDDLLREKLFFKEPQKI